jgi:hypothetical protein
MDSAPALVIGRRDRKTTPVFADSTPGCHGLLTPAEASDRQRTEAAD